MAVPIEPCPKAVVTRDVARAAGLKRCSGCHDWHPVDRFGPNRSASDGLSAMCRESTREIDRRNHVGAEVGPTLRASVRRSKPRRRTVKRGATSTSDIALRRTGGKDDSQSERSSEFVYAAVLDELKAEQAGRIATHVQAQPTTARDEMVQLAQAVRANQRIWSTIHQRTGRMALSACALMANEPTAEPKTPLTPPKSETGVPESMETVAGTLAEIIALEKPPGMAMRQSSLPAQTSASSSMLTTSCRSISAAPTT